MIWVEEWLRQVWDGLLEAGCRWRARRRARRWVRARRCLMRGPMVRLDECGGSPLVFGLFVGLLALLVSVAIGLGGCQAQTSARMAEAQARVAEARAAEAAAEAQAEEARAEIRWAEVSREQIAVIEAQAEMLERRAEALEAMVLQERAAQRREAYLRSAAFRIQAFVVMALVGGFVAWIVLGRRRLERAHAIAAGMGYPVLSDERALQVLQMMERQRAIRG